VSKATVSRALNGKVFVREEVKARILQAVADTGYRPNQLARNLANNKTNSIGLVITNGLYNGPFFSSMVYQAATAVKVTAVNWCLQTVNTVLRMSAMRLVCSSSFAVKPS
jgi:DNA-binding LacI/PurR family transcriptional regulator